MGEEREEEVGEGGVGGGGVIEEGEVRGGCEIALWIASVTLRQHCILLPMSSNTSGTPRPKREREESQSKRERERGCTVVGVGHEGVAECLEGRKSLWRTTEKLRDLLKEGTLMRDGHAVTEREGRKEMLRRVVTACRRIHPQVKERERDGEQRENRTKGNFCDDSEWTAISGPILLPVAPTHLFVTTTN